MAGLDGVGRVKLGGEDGPLGVGERKVVLVSYPGQTRGRRQRGHHRASGGQGGSSYKSEVWIEDVNHG